MASLKEIKGRIASVQSTQKITSAMKMVASAKLHHAQAAITGMWPYEQKLSGILTAFLANEQDIESPYIVARPVVKRVAIVAFSSNSSLCGAFNSNVARHLQQMCDEYKHLPSGDLLIYPIGKKIGEAAKKSGRGTIQGDFEALAEKPSFAEMAKIAYQLMDLFRNGEVDKVEILYNHFKNTASQELSRKTYLPLDLDALKQKKATTTANVDYIVEPNKQELINMLLPHTIALQLFTALLDSQASEQAARMLAMQIATDNANDILQELTVLYNKSRQQAITNELLDIMGGSMK